jgi:N-acetylmuramate 1-kinase
MEPNKQKLQSFLNNNSITDFIITKVAGDASFRSYYRVSHYGKTHILMFAPPTHERIDHFIEIDQILISHGFSAPEIIAFDEENGFILLEDFGNVTFTKALKSNENKNFELEIYQKACDVLIDLQKIKISEEIQPYNNAVLMREVMLFVDWYLPFVKKIHLSSKEKLFFELFDLLDQKHKTLVLRDYHADNLMLLKNNEIGLLDFQDALNGLPAYDLVSLLEDARRDIDEENREKLFSYYLKKAKKQNVEFNEKQFIVDYQILSLQRNIKIIGIFARLTYRDKKSQYLHYLPRVINFIQDRFKSDLKQDQSMQIFSKINHFLAKYI